MKKTGIAFLILLLVLCVFHTGIAERRWVSVPGVAAPGEEPPVDPNISDDTHSNYLSLNKYHTSWQYWSQGASAVGPVFRAVGCYMVAQSKLLVESGIESSNKTVFNPDIYYSRTSKLNNGGFTDYLCDRYRNENGVYVDGYVKDHGGTISRLADVGLTGNNQTDAATIMQYVNNGYYCILHNSGHHTYVWRQKSLELQTPVISDSSGSCSYWGGHCYELTSVNDTFNTLTPYRVSGGTYGVPGKEMTSGYSQTIPDGDYLIMSAASTDKSKLFYMDIAGSDYPAADGTNVILTQCTGDYPPVFDCWTLNYSNGFYTIKQKGTNLSLDVLGISLDSGANVMAGIQNDGPNQLFAINHEGKNGYIIRAKHSGFAIALAGGCSNDTNINQSVVTGNDNQCWLFIPYRPSQPVEEGKYFLVDGVSGNYVVGPADNANVQQSGISANAQLTEKRSRSQNHIFTLSKYGDGFYKIMHTLSGKCLEVADGLSKPSSNVVIFTDNGSIPQRWAIKSAGENKYTLITKCNGYPLDADGMSAFHNGTNVQSHFGNGGDNQRWYLEPAEYKITYDANGGTGAPAQQKKDYGQDLTLSSTVPTYGSREFIGWGTSSGSVIPQYMPGDTYTLNEDVTLYAIWELAGPGIRVSCAKNGEIVTTDTYVGTFDIEVTGPAFYEQKTCIYTYYHQVYEGTRYDITNIQVANGYELDSVTGGELSGTIGNGAMHIVLNFVEKKSRSLNVRFKVDGELRDSLDGAVTFDVDVTGNTVAVSEKGCPSFSRSFTEKCNYVISNINTRLPYVFQGVAIGSLSGEINGDITVVLELQTSFVPQAEWQEMDTLPGNIDLNISEVEYKNHYTYSGRTSPREGWTLLTEGPVQYENSGEIYQSDAELPVSETRVLVSRFYYHYCGSQKDNANWFQKSYLPTYHMIPAADFGKFNIVESGPDTDPERGTRTYYLLRWNTGDNNGNLAYCPSIVNDCGSACWYVMNVYQNRAPYRVNTYVSDSEWTSEPDPEAASASVRVRLKHYPVLLDGNGGEPDAELEKIYGIDLDLSDYTPAQEGYLFTGWNTEADGTGIHYDADYVYTANETITLFAEWQAVDVLNFPAGIKRIEAEAFMGDTTIREVVVPESCEYIGEKAFAGCTQLKKIYIPQITSIEDNAFMDCPQVVIIRTGDQ